MDLAQNKTRALIEPQIGALGDLDKELRAIVSLSSEFDRRYGRLPLTHIFVNESGSFVFRTE